MKNSLKNLIQNAKHQAQLFFETSYREIKKSNTHTVFGFPEMSNRDRLTEWGATSSALVGLQLSSDNSPNAQNIMAKSKGWLTSKQIDDGSWEASDMSLSEATAGVLIDLKKINSLDSNVMEKGISFLDSCYKDDHFISTPASIEKPHLYTTYIISKFLHEVGRLNHKEKIIHWILSAQTANSRWGQMPKSNEETAIHTIFAINILNMCGMSWYEVKSKFGNQISWIKNCDQKNNYLYEEMQFRYKSTDEYGAEYGRLRLRHFVLPIIGNFYINIGKKADALKIAKKIISQQFSGGWGPSKDELTMWATQQSIEFLINVENQILKTISNLEYLLSCVRGISFLGIKLFVTLIGAAIASILLFFPDYRASFLVGIFLMVVPWLLKRG